MRHHERTTVWGRLVGVTNIVPASDAKSAEWLAPLYRDEVDAPLNDAGSRSTEEVIYMPLPHGIHGGAPRATEEA